MDINHVSGKLSGTRASDSLKSRGVARRDQSASPPVSATDSFENSSELGRARLLIDQLVQGPEVRSEVVERARGLLAEGLLDTPERAEQAAGRFLDGEAAIAE